MKIERIYREILYSIYEKKKNSFTQKFLSEKCNVSIGNVNYALRPLEKMGAIEKKPRRFIVINPKKILMYWASVHKFMPLYQTFVEMPVLEIEKSFPQKVMFSAYSAYKFKFKDVPADYSEVYVYANDKEIREIKKRFPEKKENFNLFVLEKDEHLEIFRAIPLAQIYVDLWNINTWYAQDFLEALEKKLNKVLED